MEIGAESDKNRERIQWESDLESIWKRKGIKQGFEWNPAGIRWLVVLCGTCSECAGNVCGLDWQWAEGWAEGGGGGGGPCALEDGGRSLARLVDVLVDVVGRRQLLHWRLGLRVGHLSSGRGEVLIALSHHSWHDHWHLWWAATFKLFAVLVVLPVWRGVSGGLVFLDDPHPSCFHWPQTTPESVTVQSGSILQLFNESNSKSQHQRHKTNNYTHFNTPITHRKRWNCKLIKKWSEVKQVKCLFRYMRLNTRKQPTEHWFTESNSNTDSVTHQIKHWPTDSGFSESNTDLMT